MIHLKDVIAETNLGYILNPFKASKCHFYYWMIINEKSQKVIINETLYIFTMYLYKLFEDFLAIQAV